MKRLLTLSVFMLATTLAYAGGYRVSTQGQRALAMGHTGVAVVNSAEILFFNPAGIAFLENDLNVSGGVTAVFSNVKFQNDDFGRQFETDSPTGTPFYLYGTYAVNENLSVGLGVYTPYGSNVTWPTNWDGSHLVNEIELAAIFVQPTVSYKISDVFSVGGGPIWVTGSVDFNRNVNRTLTNENGDRTNVTVEADGVSNWGWTAGAMVKPTENLTIGFNYRSEILLEADDATATFADSPNAQPATPPNATVGASATLPLPAELTVGLAYSCDKWTFAFDYNRAFWDVYEDLTIQFDPATGLPDSVNPRNYKNASTYRFGVQYMLNDKITLRGGYYFDESPVQEGFFAPETPRNDSNGYTGGLSFQISDRFALDASFLYLRFEEVDASYDFYFENGQQVPFEGTYKSAAFLPGLGVTYKM